MVEWKKKIVKVGSLRIRKSFCIIPKRIKDTYVWLEFVYYFEEYGKTLEYDSMGYRYSKNAWDPKVIMAPSQYKKFAESSAMHLTSDDEIYRKFAQHLSKES